eukprot:GHRQ01031778.1.p1 GENE.GHRQ01031778.1~~GHRQ01031778.1.p1  ORF type:complete len:167 (-),score=47.83 GHRQ01031778.1:477-914(-)
MHALFSLMWCTSAAVQEAASLHKVSCLMQHGLLFLKLTNSIACISSTPVQVTDYRTQFSKWWVSEWKNVSFPEKGLVYDYYVDEAQCLMVPWDDKVPKFTYNMDAAASGSLFVPTVEMTRLTYFLDSLVKNRWALSTHSASPGGM